MPRRLCFYNLFCCSLHQLALLTRRRNFFLLLTLTLFPFLLLSNILAT